MHSGFDILELFLFSPIFTYLYPFSSGPMLQHGPHFGGKAPRVGVKDSHTSKIAFDQAHVVLCTRDSGAMVSMPIGGECLDQMIVGRFQLPNGPICVPEDSKETMRAPNGPAYCCTPQ